MNFVKIICGLIVVGMIFGLYSIAVLVGAKQKTVQLAARQHTGQVAFIHAACAGEKLCSFKVMARDEFLDSDKPVLKFTVVNGLVFDEAGNATVLPDSCFGIEQAGHAYHCEVIKTLPAT